MRALQTPPHGSKGVGVAQLNHLAVRARLHQPVHVPVAYVVPHSLRFELQAVAVIGVRPVLARVALMVPAAADVAADDAHPQALVRAALLTHGRLGGSEDVAAHGARSVRPLRQARAVEAVVAYGGDDAADVLVEPVQAHGAVGELGARDGLGPRPSCGARVAGARKLHFLHEKNAAHLRLHRVELPATQAEIAIIRALLCVKRDQHRVPRLGRTVTNDSHVAHVREQATQERTQL
mmetsp:Transcript_29391/g.56429  ORF Transcript_29391/g.56429 Transcript_29391/m.56429 type:complete len:236 (-) Transcript_29391:281-988(-)